VEAKFLFRPCASIAPSLESRVGRGHEKSTIENDQKRNGLLNMPRLRTMEELKRNGNEERLGGEIGRRAKGDRRRIAKESDRRQKRGETKARMPAF
jgi:hypothetical protein